MRYARTLLVVCMCILAAKCVWSDNSSTSALTVENFLDDISFDKHISAVSLGLEILSGNGGPCYDYLLTAASSCSEELDHGVNSYYNIRSMVRKVSGPEMYGETTDARMHRALNELSSMLSDYNVSDLMDGSLEKRIDQVGDSLVNATKDMDVAVKLLMKIEEYYEMRGVNISLEEAFKLRNNVTILDLVAGQLILSKTCCSDLKSFISRGCICDQGSFGKLMNYTWEHIETHWKHLLVTIAKQQCGIKIADDYHEKALSDLDDSEQCECRKAIANLQSSVPKKKKRINPVDLSQPLEFRDFRQARQYFTKKRLEQLKLDNQTTSEVLDICS